MPRSIGLLLFALVAAAFGISAASAPATADPADSTFAGTPIRSVTVRLPRELAISQTPAQVLLVVHGMGGNGVDFSRACADQADRNGWVVVAPTIDFGDWTNPAVVAQEDPRLIQALSDYLDTTLPNVIGRRVRHEALIFGHSRGAQVAHRFAEFRPDRVTAVAAVSAGTYTLPESVGPDGNLTPFPFGVQDMPQYAGHAFDPTGFDNVAFFVGVGGQDTNPADVPRQWDSIEGSTRLQRAQVFEAAAAQLGAPAVLHIFDGARHELSTDMRSSGCDFLAGAAQAAATRRMLLSIDVTPH